MTAASNGHPRVELADGQDLHLLIESQAKMRLADEYGAAQDRGEVASAGQYVRANVPNGNVSPPTANDLGLTRKEIHDARQISAAEQAEPGLVRRTVDARLAAGVRAGRDGQSFHVDRLEPAGA